MDVDQELARQFLHSEGRQVKNQVASGAETVAAVQSENFALVLMALQMPGAGME